MFDGRYDVFFSVVKNKIYVIFKKFGWISGVYLGIFGL